MRVHAVVFAGAAAFAATVIFACSSDDATTGSGSDLADASKAGDSSPSPTGDSSVDPPDTGTSDAGADAGDPCLVVATTGLDSNAGTSAAPFLTISHALGVLAAADAGTGCVHVLPGTYSTGETFPLVIPSGASLLGDEATKGAGATATKITGAFDGGSFPFQELVDPQAGSTLAGFTLHVTGGDFITAVYVTKDHVTIRNNSFVDNAASNALRFEGANNGLIRGNVFSGTANGGFSAALIFRAPSTGNRIEGNVFHHNEFGLELDTKENNDFGGGDAGSVGGNELRCNARNDVWTNESNTVFFGQNNRWDHFPPTQGQDEDGIDIRIPFGANPAVFDVDGGSVADAACP